MTARRGSLMRSIIAFFVAASAAPLLARQEPPPASAPASAPAPSVELPAPGLERLLPELAALDAKVLSDRLNELNARLKAISDEAAPLRQAIAVREAELAAVTRRANLLDSIIKARGDGPPLPAPPQPAQPQPLDQWLDQFLQAEPKGLTDHLAALQARIKALNDELGPMRARLTAHEAELPRLTAWVNFLDGLLKARNHMPPLPPKPPDPPAPPPPSAPNQAAMAPSSAVAVASPSAALAAVNVTFREHVSALFAAKCIGCHNPDKAKGGLVLETYESAMAGGGSGQVIVPGSPEKSRLYRLVSHVEQPEMPPHESRLDEAKIDLIRRWIAAGAPADGGAAADGKVAPAAPLAAIEPTGDVPPRDPDAPPVPTALPKDIGVTAAHAPPARALALSPAAPLLAIGSEGCALYYHTDTGERLGVLAFPEGRIEHLTFSSDGTQLIVVGSQPGQAGSVVVFDVERGARLGRFDKLYDAAFAGAVSADGGMIAVGGTNKKVRVFDLFDGARLQELTAHNDWVFAASFSPDGLLLATADRAGGLFVWEADTGRTVHNLSGQPAALTGLAFSGDGATLAASATDGVIRMWEMEEGRAVRQWQAHSGAAVGLAWSGAMLATCGTDGVVKLWNPDGSPVRSCEAQGDWLYRVAFSSDAKITAAGGWNGSAFLFETATGKLIRTVSTAP